MEKTLREVCESLGVTRRAVQMYEKHGLVNSCGKNKYGYLLYDFEAVKKIKEIKMYRDMGFSISQVKGVFEANEQERKKLLGERLIELKKERDFLDIQISIAEELIKRLVIDCT